MVNSLKTYCIDYVITHNVNINILSINLQNEIKRHSKKYSNIFLEKVESLLETIILQYNNFNREFQIVTKTIMNQLTYQNIIYNDNIVISYIQEDLFCKYIINLIKNIQQIMIFDNNVIDVVYNYIITQIESYKYILDEEELEENIQFLIENFLEANIISCDEYITNYLETNTQQFIQFIRCKDVNKLNELVVNHIQTSMIIDKIDHTIINNIINKFLAKFKSAMSLTNICIANIYNNKINTSILPKHIIKQIDTTYYNYIQFKYEIQQMVNDFDDDCDIIHFDIFLSELKNYIKNSNYYKQNNLNEIIIDHFVTELSLYKFINHLFCEYTYIKIGYNEFLPVVVNNKNNFHTALFNSICKKLTAANINYQNWHKHISNYLLTKLRYCKLFNYQEYFAIKYHNDEIIKSIIDIKKYYLLQTYLISEFENIVTDSFNIEFINQYIENIKKI